MTSFFDGLDAIKADLEDRFPGWQVWYVPHNNRTVTWCARPHPLLNENSPEDLAQAIGRQLWTAAGNAPSPQLPTGKIPPL
jgi:hypothetical protein